MSTFLIIAIVVVIILVICYILGRSANNAVENNIGAERRAREIIEANGFEIKSELNLQAQNTDGIDGLFWSGVELCQFYVDAEEKRLAFARTYSFNTKISQDNVSPQIAFFKDINSYEVVTQEDVDQTVGSGAAVGAYGVAMGSSTAKTTHNIKGIHIHLATSDLCNPIVKLTIWEGRLSNNSKLYAEIIEYVSKIKAVLDSHITKPEEKPIIENLSVADELKKFKDLLDNNIISQEEFDAKKKQLLNL